MSKPLPTLPDPRSGWPVHQPEAPEAPIPGGPYWYSGCDPDHPRVDPATGVCQGCGERACPACGLENCPDHTRPATRIGRTVILPGGAVIQLSRTARVLFALGLRKNLSTRTKERRSL